MRAIQVVLRFKDSDASDIEEERDMPFPVLKIEAAQLNFVFHTEAEGSLDELKAVLLASWSDLQIESLTLLE